MILSFFGVLLAFLLIAFFQNPEAVCSEKTAVCLREWLIALAPPTIAIWALFALYGQSKEMKAQRNLMLEERTGNLQERYSHIAQASITLRNRVSSEKITVMFLNPSAGETVDHCVQILADFDLAAEAIFNFSYTRIAELRSAAEIMDSITEARRHLSDQIPLFGDEQPSITMPTFQNHLGQIYARVASHGDLIMSRSVELRVRAAAISETIEQ